MSADVPQLMQAAQQCLLSGQPRLASLYIAKARRLVLAERIAVHRERAQHAIDALTAAMLNSLRPAAQEAGAAMLSFSKSVQQAQVRIDHRQDSIIRRKDRLKAR